MKKQERSVEENDERLVEQLFQYYDDIDIAETVNQSITAKEQAELWLRRTLQAERQEAYEAGESAQLLKEGQNFDHIIAQLLQTERQKRDEMVEAERERILRSLPKYPPNSDREELVLKQVREALTQPNNPNNHMKEGFVGV